MDDLDWKIPLPPQGFFDVFFPSDESQIQETQRRILETQMQRRWEKERKRRLPVELWMLVLDSVAEDDASWDPNGHLSQCRQVCKAWWHKCDQLLGPLRVLRMRSAEDVASLAVSLRTPPGTARRIRGIHVEASDGAECQWMTSVPVLLPELPNLKTLRFSDTNLSSQHTRLRQNYSLFRRCECHHLEIARPRCVKWSHLMGLVSVINPARLTLTTRGHDFRRRVILPEGPFELRLQNLSSMSWYVLLGEVTSWYFAAPRLKKIVLYVRDTEALSPHDKHVWLRKIDGLFCPPHRLPELETVHLHIGTVHVFVSQGIQR
ncbi:hypothetical protein BXZ70DRAFT_485812 [Cristinia sonorae]|uniref:F-box domain-containing protein n=1 Tax=Cristinia sonorae TaxID=1940300 RepID=A0A8K0UHV7_9AGAR|nr:hypothetical protein BXZ70DRAFT_485812 [Cristinia sonorae]